MGFATNTGKPRLLLTILYVFFWCSWSPYGRHCLISSPSEWLQPGGLKEKGLPSSAARADDF